MLSVIRVQATPARLSSHAVSRLPCSRGRVSGTITIGARPDSSSVYTGARAVPMPPVASAPALQTVMTVASAGMSAAP